MDRDTEVVAEVVRGDAALTYRALRFAKSPAIGAKQGIETVDSAVALLGRRELQRWPSVQLMLSAGPAKQAASALEESAQVRGRVLENLAPELGGANPGAHFTLGLLSVIEPLPQVPLADAVAPLRLGEDVTRRRYFRAKSRGPCGCMCWTRWTQGKAARQTRWPWRWASRRAD